MLRKGLDLMSTPILDSHATPESIADAKAAAQAEREEVYRTCGIWIDEDGQIRQDPRPESERPS